jgi:hypothetical protein
MLGSSQEFKYDKNSHSLIINQAVPLPDNPAGIGGDVDSYLQVNVQNRNSGTSASSDYVATADNGTDSMNYVDFGINSSTYDDAEFPYAGPNDGYLVAVGGDLAIVATESGKNINLFAGTNDTLSAQVTVSGMIVPVGNSYKVGNFNIMDIIAEASSAIEEAALFASGAKIVIRTDLL